MSPRLSNTRRLLAAVLAVSIAVLSLAGCSALGIRGASESPNPNTAVSGVQGGAAPGSSGEAATKSSATQDLAAGPAAQPAAAGATTRTARLMVRDVTLRVRVKDVAAASRTISTMAGAAGGYVESMQLASDRDGTVTPPQPMETGAGSPTGVQSSSAPLGGYVKVRVPAAKLTAFTHDASKLGEVLYQATDAQDVTAQHVDMKARLDNLKATEAQLRRLMARANTVAEVLAVQRELTRVQGEIESLTAQLAALDEQVAMAAVTVELVPPTSVVSPSGDDWGFLTALRNSLRAFVFTTNGIVVVLGAIAPLLIIGALVAVVVVALVQRNRKRKAPDAGEPVDQPSDEESAANTDGDA